MFKGISGKLHGRAFRENLHLNSLRNLQNSEEVSGDISVQEFLKETLEAELLNESQEYQNISQEIS